MKNTTMHFSQRKIKKNYRSITGHFPSIKNNTSIGFESKLEKAHFLSLEFDNEVILYQEQPQIEISFNSEDKIYSADCYIKRSKNKIPLLSNFSEIVLDMKLLHYQILDIKNELFQVLIQNLLKYYF